MTDLTWPLGPVLKAARERAGLGKREAARRARISEQLWRRLEVGYYTVQGEQIPLKGKDGSRYGAKVETIRDAALAVGLDPREALRLVGYPDDVLDRRGDPVSDAEAELRALWIVVNRKYGPEVASSALNRLRRDQHGGSIKTPDQPDGSSERGAG